MVCDAGRRANEAIEATQCVSCDSGKSSREESISCAPCAKGFSSPPTSSVCIKCYAGRLNTFNGSGECQECSAGKFQPDTTNATECYYCPPGKHQPATGQSQCLSCDNGTFSQLGASNCQACDRFVIIFWQSQSHTLPSNVMSTCFISAVAR
jgi:proprotein convertase subtilisin/kexin type 5